MTKIKLCGLLRQEDIEAANELMPDYVGFVFYKKSKRYVDKEKARSLKNLLAPSIKAVGVFVDEPLQFVARLLTEKIIDIAQLHGSESEEYINELRSLTKAQIIKAILVKSEADIERAKKCGADYVLLDDGLGGGKAFDRSLIGDFTRDYFLAGGLSTETVKDAIREFRPFAVDVSSAIETYGLKDKEKMTAFVRAVREEDKA